MTQRATSTFTIDTWVPEPYDEREGVGLTRTRVTRTFSGELEGQSTAELLMANAHHDSAAYVGLERIVVRLQGREGSFVLHHSATSARGAQSASWTIVPDSGTGELASIRGEGTISIDQEGGHTFTLEYELD